MLIKWLKDNVHYVKAGKQCFSIAGTVEEIEEPLLSIAFKHGVIEKYLKEAIEVKAAIVEESKPELALTSEEFRLEDLTKAELVDYALREYNLELDSSSKKDDLIEMIKLAQESRKAE